jgi:hypothetical protein
MTERAISNRAKTGNGYTELTTDQWAATITSTWQQAVASIIATGRLLTEAKAALRHGEWGKMIEKLPFSWRTTDYLMSIAGHAVLSDSQFIAKLPPSWGTLAALSALPEEEVAAMIGDGRINADMTRDDAADLVRQVKQENVGDLANARDAIAALWKFVEAYPDPAAISERLWREMSLDLRRYVDTHAVKRVAEWLILLHTALPSNAHQEAYLHTRKSKYRCKHRPLRPRRVTNGVIEDAADG